jgi:hypothetical protein
MYKNNSKQNTTKVATKVDTKEQNNIDNDIDINRQISEIDERTRQIELDALIASSNIYDEPIPEDIAQIMEQFRLLEQGQPQQSQQPLNASPHLPISLPLHNLKNYDHVAKSDIDYPHYPHYPHYPDDFNDQKNSYTIEREIKRQQDADFQACLFADQEREQKQERERKRELELEKEKAKEIKLNTLQQQEQQQITATIDIAPVLLTREELRAQRLKHFNK